MTSQQLALDYGPLPTDPDARSIEERFRAWIETYPHVYRHTVRLARQWKAAGHDTGSIAQIFEVMRWELGVYAPDQDFALNNTYRSRLSRLVMANEPDLDGFFVTRQLRSA